MTDSVDLKGIGLKVTFPRLKDTGSLSQLGEQRHLSAEDVYRRLMNEGVEMGLATVYRVLTQFEQAGSAQALSQPGGNKAVFGLNDGERHHGHLVSTSTGIVEEFVDPEIERRLRQIAERHGLQPDRIHDHDIRHAEISLGGAHGAMKAVQQLAAAASKKRPSSGRIAIVAMRQQDLAAGVQGCPADGRPTPGMPVLA